MRRRLIFCEVCALVILMACSGNAVAAEDGGTITIDVTDDDAITVADPASDFAWSVSQDGNSIMIEVDCTFDDNDNAVDFIFTIQLVGNLKNSLGQVIDTDFDTWENPSFNQTDNSAIWPIGRYAYNTLSVTFDNLMFGYTIECQLAGDVWNYSPDPDVYDHDTGSLVITIVP